ncbi:hypothetical protein FQN57_001809 [Myotisia sp. PD_48]|nr:hypothetical protein FQN57_001809 [Myotisia sp. PD_48]
MKVSCIIVGFAAVASAVTTRNCRAGLLDCGHTLLNLDPHYLSRIDDSLARTGIAQANAHQQSESLFFCNANGSIDFVKECAKGCLTQVSGVNDKCAE